MKCPHCGQELELPSHAIGNIDQYRGTVLTITECCGYGVRLESLLSFRVHKVEPQKEESNDDWGYPIRTRPTRVGETFSPGPVAKRIDTLNLYS